MLKTDAQVLPQCEESVLVVNLVPHLHTFSIPGVIFLAPTHKGPQKNGVLAPEFRMRLSYSFFSFSNGLAQKLHDS